jgi:p-aminobenzoyl-glutamate transporter AbgT
MLYICDRQFGFGYANRIKAFLPMHTSKPAAVMHSANSTNAIATANPMPASSSQTSEQDLDGFLEKSFLVLVFVAIIYVMGQFIDALRDVLEDRLGIWKNSRSTTDKNEIDWKQITKMEPDERQAWDDYFFSYYVFAANMVIAALLVVALCIFCIFCPPPYLAAICFVAMTLVFLCSAASLRGDVKAIVLDSARNRDNKHSRKRSVVVKSEPKDETGEEPSEE